ncbi:hypothetical protein KUL152_04990 [Tenacibaculum sp. KUL152]|nr:hypothetical protein KUL152_04990 [Tenacibaculum sp. KUL152]
MLKELSLAISLMLSSFFCYANTDIKIWNRDEDVPGMVDYIELFAELTVDEFGPYTLTSSIPLEQGRAIKELQSGNLLNLAVMGNDIERESMFIPIYYPLDRGLLGMRLCVVRVSDKDLLADIKNLEDIRRERLIIGSGTHWPDTAILLANEVPLSVSPRFDSLLTMLNYERFDCLHRSINEIGAESIKYAANELMVDEHIALVYPLANIIYVSPKEPKLAERMKRGLELAIEQNKLSPIYEKYFGQVLQETTFYSRRLILLENPNLTTEARKAINEHGLISFEKAH